jgi:hypothetical protein
MVLRILRNATRQKRTNNTFNQTATGQTKLGLVHGMDVQSCFPGPTWSMVHHSNPLWYAHACDETQGSKRKSTGKSGTACRSMQQGSGLWGMKEALLYTSTGRAAKWTWLKGVLRASR